MTRDIFSELAQQLGKSREEVVQFFQVLWQLVPPSPETQPYFFRYLDERFGRIEDRYEFLHQELERQIGGLRKEMEQQIGGLRKEMEQGFAQAAERDEALRREFQQQGDGLRQEFQQQIDGLRQEMQQQIDGLRREMQQQIDGLRREMQQGFAQAAERDEALRREIARLERWLFTLWVPVLGALVGVLGLLLQILLRLS